MTLDNFTPIYDDGRRVLYEAECVSFMQSLPANSVDCIVTDPPYLISFMSKAFDQAHKGQQGQNEGQRMQAWHYAWAVEAWRVTKPGGMLAAFGGTRTFHRLACALEDAGWDIRDTLCWMYGSGFPKGANISKHLDKMAGRIGENVQHLKWRIRQQYETIGMTLDQFNMACGFEASGYLRESSTWATVLPSREKWAVMKAVLQSDGTMDALFEAAEREVIGKSAWTNSAHHFQPGADHTERVHVELTAPATDAAKQWEGYGSNLKPSYEPILLCRKPLQGNLAQNILRWSTGGLNIDASRLTTTDTHFGRPATHTGEHEGWQRPWKLTDEGQARRQRSKDEAARKAEQQGRWPGNAVLSHDARCLPQGTRRVKGTAPPGQPSMGTPTPGTRRVYGQVAMYGGGQIYADAEGYELVDAYQCHPDCAVAALDRQAGEHPGPWGHGESTWISPSQFHGNYPRPRHNAQWHDGTHVSRFFKTFPPEAVRFQYVSKADTKQRGEQWLDPYVQGRRDLTEPEADALAEGLAGITRKGMTRSQVPPELQHLVELKGYGSGVWRSINDWPTVKPIAILEWIMKLCCPPGGVILEPFCGSGSGLLAARNLGYRMVACEQDHEACDIAVSRINETSLPLFQNT